MAKATSTTKKKETKEIKKEEPIIEVKEEIKEEPKKEIKKEVKKETKKEVKEEIIKNKVAIVIDTPYVPIPDVAADIIGYYKPGDVCTIEEEVNMGDRGVFYKVGKNRYISKDWKYSFFKRKV